MSKSIVLLALLAILCGGIHARYLQGTSDTVVVASQDNNATAIDEGDTTASSATDQEDTIIEGNSTQPIAINPGNGSEPTAGWGCSNADVLCRINKKSLSRVVSDVLFW